MSRRPQSRGGSAGRAAGAAPAIALLAAGLALRLIGLGGHGLWLDESVSLRVASRPLAEIAAGAVFDNHTPPLYYLLLHGWLQLVPGGVVGLRLLSVLLDLGCLALLLAVARRWFGHREALLVGTAYAVSPFALRLAQEGRMYPLLMLLVVACAALAVELENRPQRRWPAVALAATAAAALYTHYYAALSLLALHAVMAWRLRAEPTLRRRWWGAMGTALLLFLPWTPVAVELWASGGQSFRGAGWLELPQALFRFTAGYALLPMSLVVKREPWMAVRDHLPLLVAAAAASGAALLLGVWRLAVEPGGLGPRPRDDTRPGAAPAAAQVVLALAAGPPLLALTVALAVPSLDERYLAVCFPFFVVLVVHGLSGPRRPVLRGLVTAVLVTVWLAGTVAHLRAPDAGLTPWDDALAELQRVARPGARVVVEPGYYVRLIRRRLGDRFDVVRPERLSAADLDPDGRETWLLEVTYLARGDWWLRRGGWSATLRSSLPAGNGIRLSRLRPAGTPLSAAPRANHLGGGDGRGTAKNR